MSVSTDVNMKLYCFVQVMVRTYVRKTTRGAGVNWSHGNLLLAIDAVRNKSSSTNQAAVNFGIPEPTLRRYLQKSTDQYPVSNGRFRPVFPENMEKALAEYIMEVSGRFYGMTTVQLRQLAFDFAERNQLQHNFDRSARAAGTDWLAGFLKRNQEISLRMPEMMSLARIQGFNPKQVENFFILLAELYQKHNFAPSRIFNVDETGVPTVPTKIPKILSAKGVKRVAKVVSAERGKTITLVCSMNATGNFIPPAFIFPRVRMCREFLDCAPLESLGLAQKSGWMNQELFPEYLLHFVKHTKPSPEDPVLLILDNHTSHLSLAAIEYCRKHSIVMLTLPPHGSHMMQPLDVTFFGPFKTFYSQACDNWVVNHPGRPITERQIGGLVKEAFERAATAGNARRGFEQTGIWPFNPLTFNASDFAPSLTSDRPLDVQQSSSVPASVNSNQVNMQAGQTSSAPSDCPASLQQLNQSSLAQISEQAVLQEEVPTPVTVSAASDFAPSVTSDRLLDAQQSSSVPASVNSNQVNMQPGQTSSAPSDCTASSQQLNQSSLAQISEQAVLQEEVPTPVTVSAAETKENKLQQLNQSCASSDVMPEERSLDEEVCSQAILPDVTNDTNPQHRDQPSHMITEQCSLSPVAKPRDKSTLIITPQAIRPYPVDSRVHNPDQSGQKRKRRRAVIATSSPYKSEVEMTDKAKKKKLATSRARGQQLNKTGAARRLCQPDTGRVNKTTLKSGKRSQSSIAKKPKLAVNEDKTPCGYCNYVYGDSDDPLLDEDWFACAKCNGWCHESCGTCVKRQFHCYCCTSSK